MREIDILAYKVDSFDSCSFEEDIILHKHNSIILMFNSEKAWVSYKPSNSFVDIEVIPFFKFNNPRVDYLLFPILFVINHFRIFRLFLSIFKRYKPKVVLVENTYVTVLIGIMRPFFLFEKIIYLPGDWLQGNKANIRIWSYFGSEVVFPLFDYWACRLSDLVVNCTELIIRSRHEYWRKSIAKKEIVFQNRLKIKSEYSTGGSLNNKIVFIGTARQDSGLDFVVRSLLTLRKAGISLKIIGRYNENVDLLNKFAQHIQVDNYINYLGFLDRDKFAEALSDCFCGVNLLTNEENYSSRTLPAKLFDYLQYLLPVVVTKNIGPLAQLVQKEELGLVIELDEATFVKAVIEIYENQNRYRNNIVKYISSFDNRSITEIIDNL